ncbi:MAG TPA: hypothetical protein VMW21_00755 [Patescibacteria group bacterium]|nr:hypothetical protein [Patescibacteria group bacterium]
MSYHNTDLYAGLCSDSRENAGLAVFIIYAFWAGFIFCYPGYQVRNGAIIYLILGIITLAVKTASVVKSGKSSLAQEITFGLKNCEIFIELLLWPVIAILFIFRDPYQNSYKRIFSNNYWQRTMSERPGIHVETVNEWTENKVSALSRQADEQAQKIAETAKPAVRVAAASTLAVSIIATPARPQTPNVQATVFTDRQGDRQSSFTVSQGRFVLLEQNRVAADGSSNTSLLGPGIKFSPLEGLNTTFIAGPQFNWKDDGKIGAVKVIFNFSWQRKELSLFSANWLAYGPTQRRITSSRHIQKFKIPGLPAWLQPSFEELHIKGGTGFTELFTGLDIKFGQWLGKNNFFNKASLTPYYNWAKRRERWDARLTLSF